MSVLILRNAALRVFGIVLIYHSLCFLFLCCNESVNLVSCVFFKVSHPPAAADVFQKVLAQPIHLRPEAH